MYHMTDLIEFYKLFKKNERSFQHEYTLVLVLNKFSKLQINVYVTIDIPTQGLETEVISCDDPSFAFTVY